MRIRLWGDFMTANNPFLRESLTARYVKLSLLPWPFVVQEFMLNAKRKISMLFIGE